MIFRDTDNSLKPYLVRIARHAMKGVMPKAIRLGERPHSQEDFWRLNEITGGGCSVKTDGTLVLAVSGAQTEPVYWRELVAFCGLASKPEGPREPVEKALLRLQIAHPDFRSVLATLGASETVRRFLAKGAAAEHAFAVLFEAGLTRLAAKEDVTLSQLGSDLFTDSKRLRSGPALAVFIEILRALADQPELGESELLSSTGVEVNPYTAHVIAFVPFAFRMNDQRYDFPRELFEAGQAAVLPWETVRLMENTEVRVCDSIMTSENAAPFYRYVKAGVPAVYTEGYPNSSVKRLLSLFAQAGLHAVHAGDTDLDGYRIAEQIGRCIPVEGLALSGDALRRLPRKVLSDEQHRRLAAFLAAHSDFRYAAELRETLAGGWVEQESLRGK